jgi:RNA polymerase sigma-70 factor, ECF subfamily
MININTRPRRLVLTPRYQTADDAGGLLRRYGLAVVRDNRLICDERSAAVLVDNLSRRAALAARNGEGSSRGDSRLRLFSLFICLHRRHVRMAAMEDGFGDFLPLHPPGETDSRERASSLERAIRNLPLELRESLLLVVLERFSHSEAAEALDIPLATLMDRLARARATLAVLSQRRSAPSRNPPDGLAWRRGAPHLRLVK